MTWILWEKAKAAAVCRPVILAQAMWSWITFEEKEQKIEYNNWLESDIKGRKYTSQELTKMKLYKLLLIILNLNIDI